MKHILFIHQSSELYGSDKTLFLLVSRLKQRDIQPIVVLPNPGPLLDLLHENNINTIVAPVLKVSRTMFTLRNLLSLPGQVMASIKTIEKATAGQPVDLVYSNTLAVLIGLVYARKKKLKHIWHIHEIIEHPRLITKIFRKLIFLKANNKIIFNSKATQRFWEADKKARSVIIWNGLSKPDEQEIPEQAEAMRQVLGAGPNQVLIALVGRINRQKGQLLLLSAFKQLAEKYPQIRLVFVGSHPPNQPVFQERLIEKIAEYQLENSVRIIPFQKNIWQVWRAIDLAVVPSTEPESFGLVAVEAMLCKKPVIASDHGGVREIVVHEETGLFFEPGNAEALQNALECLILDENKRNSMGQKGYERASTLFTLDKYVNQVEQVCLSI